jgi:gamma-glutamyltranspeptidase/glutathione hydrolase
LIHKGKGTISSGDVHTSQAGAAILEAGGNAYDAICAALLSAPLSEPMLSSAGGGGFLLSYDKDHQSELYDFFVDVPPNRDIKKDFYPITVDFGNTQQDFHIGMSSAAVPGVLAGIHKIHQEKGSLPLCDIITPALKLADEGFYLSKMQAKFVKLLEPILASTDSSKALFFIKDKLIDHTQRFVNHEYADFLRAFAAEGSAIFYQGEIADRIETMSKQYGGLLDKDILQSYQVHKREPIQMDFRNCSIVTNPPPSAGGVLISFALKLMDELDMGTFNSPQHLISLIETLVSTADFRHEYINEHLHAIGLEQILDDENLIHRFINQTKEKVNFWGNTTHISVMDAQGNCASSTLTNGEGCGHVIPGTGIMLNNMLGEEDLNPHGFFKWEAGVRLPSMMAPTVVLKEGKPSLVLGSAGSNRIRSAITQAILNYTVFHKSITETTRLPRLHFERNQLFFEPDINENVLRRAKEHFIVTEFDEQSLFFGGVNAVDSSLEGGSDPRRGGSVIRV